MVQFYGENTCPKEFELNKQGEKRCLHFIAGSRSKESR